MKKILPFLTVFIIIAIIVIIFLSMSNKKQMLVIYEGNHTHTPIDIKLNHFQDTQCGMTITQNKHSAQAISPEGKTWFFDDVGCLALWYNNIKFQKEAILWVYTNDTNEYIDARTAWFNRTDTTPMGHGFGAFKNKQDGFITFEEVTLKVLRGEDLRNPFIKKELLGK
ncbi:MAG: hypothetical protein RBS32_10825 [Aliarcobacter sp.]|nr:hypothetical protein [Aliarcobacter sp.]